MGKTSLAIEAARELVGELRDGVWLVGLGDARPRPSRSPRSIADALPFGAAGPEPARRGPRGDRRAVRAPGRPRGPARPRRLRAPRRRRRARSPSACCEAADGVRILATSRQALGAHGEAIVERRAVRARRRGRAAAVRRARPRGGADVPARRRHARGGDDDRHAPGRPAARARARRRPRPRAAGRRDRRRAWTTASRCSATPAATAPARGTLRHVVEWSFDLLRRARAGAVLPPGGVPRAVHVEAAERVAGGGAVDRDALPDLLASLVDRSMLSVDDGPLPDARDPARVRPAAPRRARRARERAAAARRLGGDDRRRPTGAGCTPRASTRVRVALAPHRADLDAAVELALDEGDGALRAAARHRARDPRLRPRRQHPRPHAPGARRCGSTRPRTARVPALTMQSLLLTMHGLRRAGPAGRPSRRWPRRRDQRWRDRAQAGRGARGCSAATSSARSRTSTASRSGSTLRGETWLRGFVCGWQGFVRLVLGELVEAQRLSTRAVEAFERCSDVWGLLDRERQPRARRRRARRLRRRRRRARARGAVGGGPRARAPRPAAARLRPRPAAPRALRPRRRAVAALRRARRAAGDVGRLGAAHRPGRALVRGHGRRPPGAHRRRPTQAAARYAEARALLEAVEREERDTIGINAAIATSLLAQGECTDPTEAGDAAARGARRARWARATGAWSRARWTSIARPPSDAARSAELLGAADGDPPGGGRPAAAGRAPRASRRSRSPLRAELGDDAYEEARRARAPTTRSRSRTPAR